eukprot:gene190-522_t
MSLPSSSSSRRPGAPPLPPKSDAVSSPRSSSSRTGMVYKHSLEGAGLKADEARLFQDTRAQALGGNEQVAPAASDFNFHTASTVQEDSVLEETANSMFDEITKETLVKDVLAMCLQEQEGSDVLHDITNEIISEAINEHVEVVSQKCHAVVYSDRAVALRRRQRDVEKAQSSVYGLIGEEILQEVINGQATNLVKGCIKNLSSDYMYNFTNRNVELKRAVHRNIGNSISEPGQEHVVICLDDLSDSCCPICFEPVLENKQSENCVDLQCCKKHVCYSCMTKHVVTQIRRRKCNINDTTCPFCNQHGHGHTHADIATEILTSESLFSYLDRVLTYFAAAMTCVVFIEFWVIVLHYGLVNEVFEAVGGFSVGLCVWVMMYFSPVICRRFWSGSAHLHPPVFHPNEFRYDSESEERDQEILDKRLDEYCLPRMISESLVTLYATSADGIFLRQRIDGLLCGVMAECLIQKAFHFDNVIKEREAREQSQAEDEVPKVCMRLLLDGLEGVLMEQNARLKADRMCILYGREILLVEKSVMFSIVVPVAAVRRRTSNCTSMRHSRPSAAELRIQNFDGIKCSRKANASDSQPSLYFFWCASESPIPRLRWSSRGSDSELSNDELSGIADQEPSAGPDNDYDDCFDDIINGFRLVLACFVSAELFMQVQTEDGKIRLSLEEKRSVLAKALIGQDEPPSPGASGSNDPYS